MERYHHVPPQEGLRFHRLRDGESGEGFTERARVGLGSIVRLKWPDIGVTATVQVVDALGDESEGMRPLTRGSAVFNAIEGQLADDTRQYRAGTLSVIILAVDNRKASQFNPDS